MAHSARDLAKLYTLSMFRGQIGLKQGHAKNVRFIAIMQDNMPPETACPVNRRALL
jgi:hypothetical protein